MASKAMENQEKVFNIISTVFLIILCLAILYPIYFVVIASFSEPESVMSGEVLFLPHGFNLSGYKRIFSYKPLWIGYKNSIFYTIVGGALSTVLTLFAAYPLSRSDFKPRRKLTVFFLIAMFFQGGLVPTYLLVNYLHLRNTYAVLLIISGIQVMNLIMASSYFRSTYIPSLYEAAELDGCSHFGYFFRILIPISTPIIIVLFLFYGVFQWNDYFRAMIYLDREQYYPIQLVLKELLASNQVTGSMFEMLSEDQEAFSEMLRAAESMKYGIILMATLPMLLVYLCLQKYFIKGITLGSVKG